MVETEVTPALDRIKEYASQWDNLKNIILVAYPGIYRNRKNYIACCIANVLFNLDLTVRMAKLTDLINGLFDKYNKNDYLMI